MLPPPIPPAPAAPPAPVIVPPTSILIFFVVVVNLQAAVAEDEDVSVPSMNINLRILSGKLLFHACAPMLYCDSEPVCSAK